MRRFDPEKQGLNLTRTSPKLKRECEVCGADTSKDAFSRGRTLMARTTTDPPSLVLEWVSDVPVFGDEPFEFRIVEFADESVIVEYAEHDALGDRRWMTLDSNTTTETRTKLYGRALYGLAKHLAARTAR